MGFDLIQCQLRAISNDEAAISQLNGIQSQPRHKRVAREIALNPQIQPFTEAISKAERKTKLLAILKTFQDSCFKWNAFQARK